MFNFHFENNFQIMEEFKLENCHEFGSFPEKGGAFSTSTPLVHSKLDDSLPPRSLSNCVWSPNDSGYADSICSSNTSDICQVTSNDSFTQFRLHNSDLSPSPTAVAQSSGSLQADKYVPRFSLGVHLLDYEIPEEEHVYEKFSPNKSPIPHYSLEDEDMCTEDSWACTAPSPTKQTIYSNLTERFKAALHQCMPTEPDRMIGRKMGLDQVDLVSELSDRGMMIIIERIVSYLQSSDIRRLVCSSHIYSHLFLMSPLKCQKFCPKCIYEQTPKTDSDSNC